MNLLSIAILLMLLVDWVSYGILLVGGIALAWLAFKLTTPSGFIYIPGTVNYKDIISTFMASISLGLIFSRNKYNVEKQKLEAMKLLAANIAHELRTPLATIKASANGIKDYLPTLVKTYKMAAQENLPIPAIYPHQFEALQNVLDQVETETDLANTVIDMLLVSVRQSEINSADFETYAISHCINEALSRYPFSHEDARLINWDRNNDFLFRGNELLTIHILFNLIKNSLYYVMAAREGSIKIWTRLDKKYNFLHFYDTGGGIDPAVLPRIFDRFFSKTYHGYGVGLAFCKMIMSNYNGDIVCNSVKGEYTEFVLKFPVVNNT